MAARARPGPTGGGGCRSWLHGTPWPGCREERSPLRCSIRRPSDPGGGDARPRPGRGYREESDLPVIGVLALQGDVREHLRALGEAGADAVPVRRLSEIEACDGLGI